MLREPQSIFTIVNVALSTQCLCSSTESGSYSLKFAVKYWVSYLPWCAARASATLLTLQGRFLSFKMNSLWGCTLLWHHELWTHLNGVQKWRTVSHFHLWWSLFKPLPASLCGYLVVQRAQSSTRSQTLLCSFLPICLQDKLPSHSLWAETPSSRSCYRIKVVFSDTVFYMWLPQHEPEHSKSPLSLSNSLFVPLSPVSVQSCYFNTPCVSALARPPSKRGFHSWNSHPSVISCPFAPSIQSPFKSFPLEMYQNECIWCRVIRF